MLMGGAEPVIALYGLFSVTHIALCYSCSKHDREFFRNDVLKISNSSRYTSYVLVARALRS
jgi:hypothetical protein